MSQVEVVEAYSGWRPPFSVRSVVEHLIGQVPPHYLIGLSHVVLTNSGSLTGDRRRGSTLSRGRKVRLVDAAGLYHQAWRNTPAHVELFVDRMLGDCPYWLFRSRFVRELTVTRTLYHEFGHHIHATQKPEHREKENVAEDWTRNLATPYFRRRYPYVIPIAALLRVYRRWRGLPTRRSRRTS